MSKIMTVDILSSIKGAVPSEAVNKLFEVIKNANLPTDNTFPHRHNDAVPLDDLREDIIIQSSEVEKKIIIQNFPQAKDNYLVVSKVIEE